MTLFHTLHKFRVLQFYLVKASLRVLGAEIQKSDFAEIADSSFQTTPHNVWSVSAECHSESTLEKGEEV